MNLSVNAGSAAKRILIGFGSGAFDLKVAAEGFQMTAQGLRKLGSGTTDSSGGKTPGADLGVLGLIATHNPAGLIISSGVKIYGQESGRSTVEGRARQRPPRKLSMCSKNGFRSRAGSIERAGHRRARPLRIDDLRRAYHTGPRWPCFLLDVKGIHRAAGHAEALVVG